MSKVSEYTTEYKALLDKINELNGKLVGATNVQPTITNFRGLYEKIKESGVLNKMTAKKDGKAKQELQLSLMKDIAECFDLSLKIVKKGEKAKNLEKKLASVNDTYEILNGWNNSEKISTTTEKALMTILDNEQAFNFWKANVGTALNDTIRVKAFWEKLRETYSNQTFNDPSNKMLNITPYALKVVVDLCDGWDNFVEACKEANPFESIICTKSRATLCNNTKDDMAPKDKDKFYKDRATCGQAPFGSFFLLVKTHPDAEEEMAKWSVLDSTGNSSGAIAVLVPASKSLPDSWKMESQGRILSMNTRKYLTWQPGRRNRITLQGESSDGLRTWSVKNGIIYCKNTDSKSIYEDAFCLCSDGGNMTKGDGSMDDPVIFTFVNYLPWIEGEDVEDTEEEEKKEEKDDDDDDDDNKGDEEKEEEEEEEEEETDGL